MKTGQESIRSFTLSPILIFRCQWRIVRTSLPTQRSLTLLKNVAYSYLRPREHDNEDISSGHHLLRHPLIDYYFFFFLGLESRACSHLPPPALLFLLTSLSQVSPFFYFYFFLSGVFCFLGVFVWLSWWGFGILVCCLAGGNIEGTNMLS